MNIANSHSNAPFSSHHAADNMEASGKLRRHKRLVMMAIKAFPGSTGGEIADIAGLEHVEAQRRISDLKRDGFVVYVGKRKCNVKGSMMSAVWEVE